MASADVSRSRFDESRQHLVGASAAIYGVMLAYAVRWPDDEFLLWFVVPVKAKWLVAGCILFDLLLGVSNGFGGRTRASRTSRIWVGLSTRLAYLHTPPSTRSSASASA